ncbi:hypothetical protein FA13DRAFT_1709947 [Coprinellus micaceus]|uniref:CxC1-like cysteine cluster associated with KDZ transposases domain-containing protein n=1 Tax=Coprinellus micaceus TaxID=71717 RepID=A0A4Y7TAA1_COPMI|nr:hypothetical protein FA13DRAFT_1709947 [Coprinellus micaceus]
MYRAKDVLSYYVLDEPIREEENLTKGGLPVYPTAEWNRYKGIKSICQVEWMLRPRRPNASSATGLEGVQVGGVHPEEDKFPGLWWQPTEDDSVVLQSGIIITTRRYLKKDAYLLLEAKLHRASDMAFFTLAQYLKATLLGSLVTHAKQCLERLEAYGLTHVDILVTVGDFQRSCLDFMALSATWLYTTLGLTPSPQTKMLLGPATTPSWAVSLRAGKKLSSSTRSASQSGGFAPNGSQCFTLFASEDAVMTEYTQFGTEDRVFHEIYSGLPGTQLQMMTQRLGCRVFDLVEPSRIAWQNLDKKLTKKADPTHPIQPVHLFCLPGFKEYSAAEGGSSLPIATPSSTSNVSGSSTSSTSTTSSVPATPPQRSTTPMPAPSMSSSPQFPSLPINSRVHRNFGPDPMPSDTDKRPPEIEVWTGGVSDLTVRKHPEIQDTLFLTYYTPDPNFILWAEERQGPSYQKRHKKNSYLESLPVRSGTLERILYFKQVMLLGSAEDLKKAVTPSITAEVIWELREDTWHLELMALDQALAPKHWPPADEDLVDSSGACHTRLQRETAIRQVLPAHDGEELGEIFVTEILTIDRGLVSYHWSNRHGYLLALRELMLSWHKCPESIVDADTAHIELPSRKLERLLVKFYCESFFDMFGRALIVPCRLPYRARIREVPVVLELLSSLSHYRTHVSVPPDLLYMRHISCRCSCISHPRGGLIKFPKVLKRRGLTLRPQVDVRIAGVAYAQRRRKHKSGTSTVPRTPLKMTSPTPQKGDKRLLEWDRWRELIPRLIPTYMQLLQQSNNLRSISRDIPSPCTCMRGRSLQVTVYGLNGTRDISVCSCCPAAALLLNGYFPSAPLRPSVAFDIGMLEFARELYLRSSPNRSAFAAALDSYYPIPGVERTRRKLAKACHYYALLLVEADAFARRRVALLCSVDGRDEAEDWEDDGVEESLMEYLRSCCPLCFGAVAEHDDLTPALSLLYSADVIKRRTPARGTGHDPPFRHPRSVFLTEEELQDAKHLVESAHPPAAPSAAANANDVVEKGMKVSESVLNTCSDSFKAADENRNKASPTFFSDTGLMALLCHHDRVLWLANVTTSREQQFYVIALILKLFKSIPCHMTVGILYDIGCQLHRSCVKWDFIPDFIDRIIWGISVFHAYGHLWPCQLVYHPRKCVGFGLSDGEGCERFWSSIQGLIPSLRVSGYHQCILTLDFQIKFLQENGLAELTGWLVRKWNTCQRKKSDAQVTLVESGLSLEEPEELWEDQVKVQTRPLVTATGGLAKAAIKLILELTEYQKSITKEIDSLDCLVKAGDVDVGDAVERRAILVGQLENTTVQIRRKRGELGVRERANLKQMESSQYLKLRMQARALKDCLQSKLRDHKSELERFNRVSRHEPTIVKIAQRFNKLVDDLADLIRKRRAPWHAIAPKQVDRSTLFSLGINDPIWNDRGLEESDLDVPRWLGDDEVQTSIAAMLVLSRCEEEECYLIHEAVLLQSWYMAEWEQLNHAVLQSNSDFRYYLERKRGRLVCLGALWHETLDGTGVGEELDGWGPSEQDFASVLATSTGVGMAGSPADSSEVSKASEGEEVLWEMEALHLGSDSSPYHSDSSSDEGTLHPPAKRKRPF